MIILTKVSYGKYIDGKGKKTKKLKVDDYLFQIDNEDINKANITYEFMSYEVINYEDGKKEGNKVIPTIKYTLSGENSSGKESWISFIIDLDINKLNELNSELIDITKYINESEAFVKRANDKNPSFINFYLPKNNIDDMYRNTTSLYVYKLKDNSFIFKLSIPTENIFTSFKIDF